MHPAYILKESCLRGDAKMVVENIEDVTLIWTRIEQKYGDKLDLVEMVIKDLEKISNLKNYDDMKFISLGDILENSLQDLEAIGVRQEIANPGERATIVNVA